jgi:carboxylate-amine ligase
VDIAPPATGPPPVSVLAHRFGSSGPYTVGVEEEYMLVDPISLDLVAGIEPLLANTATMSLADVTCEIFQSEIEAHTPVCGSLDDLERELRRLRNRVAEAVRVHGVSFASAGTHPFALFEEQAVTDRERYREIVDEMQYVVRRDLVYGLHVHVGTSDPDVAIAVTEGLLADVAPLIALSANSPFWRGAATGLASTRQAIFSAGHRAGLTPYFRDWAEFVDIVTRLEQAGLRDYTRFHWDVRPHPWLGTVEVRAMDAVSCVDDAIALAAFVQAAVKAHSEDARRRRGDPHHRLLLAENKWRAVRYGLDAQLLDLARGGVVAAPELVRRRLGELRPHARELGAEHALDDIQRLLHAGNGARRQLEVFERSGDLADVVRDLVLVSESHGSPTTAPA